MPQHLVLQPEQQFATRRRQTLVPTLWSCLATPNLCSLKRTMDWEKDASEYKFKLFVLVTSILARLQGNKGSWVVYQRLLVQVSRVAHQRVPIGSGVRHSQNQSPDVQFGQTKSRVFGDWKVRQSEQETSGGSHSFHEQRLPCSAPFQSNQTPCSLDVLVSGGQDRANTQTHLSLCSIQFVLSLQGSNNENGWEEMSTEDPVASGDNDRWVCAGCAQLVVRRLHGGIGQVFAHHPPNTSFQRVLEVLKLCHSHCQRS